MRMPARALGHLEELPAAEAPERPKLIVFEALYSMDGDVAPVNRICDLAERYGSPGGFSIWLIC